MNGNSHGRLITAVVVFIGLGFIAWAQTRDYFQQYPGGFTRAAYEITTEELENPIQIQWQVEALDGDELRVITTNEVIAPREAFQLGVANGVAQAQLIIQDQAVQALLENRTSLQPNMSFILPGGARFTTTNREMISGVSALCGLLTDPEKPDRRTLLAISEESTLPFPPWIRLEKLRSSTGAETTPLRFCRSLAPLLSSAPSSGQAFVATFELVLTEFERRE
jgi:hypothetical protein